MNNKQLLKTKLAHALHGYEEDATLVKESARAKALKSSVGKYFSRTEKNPSKFELDAKQLTAAIGLATAIGAGGMKAFKAGKGIHKAQKLKKMSPLKRALVKGFGEDTVGRKALMFGGGAAGLTAGIKGVEALSDSITKPIKKRSAFKGMMADNPGLSKESPKDVKRVFNTLFRFNPKMAADPLVAGSFMKRTLQFKDEGIQPVDVKTLTEVGRNMAGNNSNSSILSGAFLGGAKELANFAG